MRDSDISRNWAAPVLGRALSVALAGLIAVGMFAGSPATAQEAAPPPPPEKIVLQLRWEHQAQFAGYYAAVWQGYYADAGFDVEVRSAFPEGGRVNPIEEVLQGRADFGIGAADVLVAIDGGAPLRIASPVFQQSGFGLISRVYSRVASPADIVGMAVMRPNSDLARAEFDAVLAAEGIDPSKIRWVDGMPGTGPTLLENRTIDAYFTFWPAGNWLVKNLGLPGALLRPSAYGVDFYGDAIFTSEQLAEQNPELVQRFIDASLKGWEFALTHPDAIADRIATDLVRAAPVPKPQLFNRSMLNEIGLVVLHYPEIPLGHSNPDRWASMFGVLSRAGLVDGNFKYLDYVFDPAARDAVQRTTLFQILGAALVAALAFAGGILAWSWTLRKQVLARTRDLEDSQERYALAVAGTDSGIWDWDILAGQSYRSARWHEILGYTEASTPPGVDAFFDLVHPDDLPGLKHALTLHLEDRIRFEIDFRMRHADGRFIWVHESGQAVWGADGTPQHMAGSITDITDRVEAAEALTAAKEAAEIAMKEAERASQAKTDFLSSMSHELRSPLNAILGFSQILDRDLDPVADANRRRYTGHVLSSGRHLMSLIEDVLDLAQIDATGVSLDLKNLDPVELVMTASTTARHLADQRGIEFRDLTTALQLPLIKVDSPRLHQVLLNILTNGVKYNTEGGSLLLSAEETEDRFLRFS
ncbi:MAG: ABC transporter substrate-binding protein, partial [Alphaproteobacteria bacterium]|nr:ABC transporter substrate-binding protein [Alphaproteobacteria bacterium]